VTLVGDGLTAILSMIRLLGASCPADAVTSNTDVTGRHEAD
jgi:hypothetical protein